MTLDERFENVGVMGAAGKMGSGIVLLVAQEMAKLKIQNPLISTPLILAPHIKIWPCIFVSVILD